MKNATKSTGPAPVTTPTHSGSTTLSRDPVAAGADARTTTTLPPLPLFLRFPPTLNGDEDDCETPELVTESAEAIAADFSTMLPLLSMDGPALVAHLAAMTPEAREKLHNTATDFHSHAGLLDRLVWPLSCVLGTLSAHLEVEAGGLRSDPLDGYDATHQTPEGSRRWVMDCAAQAWTELGHEGPQVATIGGKRHRYYPEEITPHRWVDDNVSGWIVPVGAKPKKPECWGFVPDDRAAGAPELAAMVEG